MIAPLALIAAALVAAPNDREISVDGGTAPLYGSLMTAPAAKRGPGVLIIAGSGPTDRNGDSTQPGVKPSNLRLIAEGLAAEGIPSIRFDKRAIAKSAPAGLKEEDLRFTTAVDDAVLFGKLLAAQPGVTCVVILGHSEGALIATLAAQKMPVCGVIEVSGMGRTMGQVLRQQLKPQLPPPLMAKAEVGLAELEAGRTTPNIPGLEALFRPSVQPYLISQLSIDPAASLKAVKAPVLILQGDNDLQVTLEDAGLLAAARPEAKKVILPGVNHVLKPAPRDPAGNMVAYAGATPLDPSVMPPIIAFVNASRAGK
jgi:alpha-beta hydrolase superfamily lysophospholipase